MACCGQSAAAPGVAVQDSGKRVNYTLGMLLGVDDFVQESAYQGARRRELARELLGYGTVRGLQVVLEADGDRGPQLRVTPGTAWTPSGAAVCVETDQCCSLNAWLRVHGKQVEQALGAAGSPSPSLLMLHAVLAFAECLTDNVPIPGEPCRSEAGQLQPSRVADGFRLELRLLAPAQREENAVRDFVDWISDIPVGDNSPPLTEDAFVEQLRDAAKAWLDRTSPSPDPDDFMFGSAPASTRVGEDLLRLALRIWTTELRPLWRARFGRDGGNEAPGGADDAVLLASIELPLVTGASGWQIDDTVDPVTLRPDESRRPILLSLRMVQELIAQHPSAEAGDAVVPADAFGLLPIAGTGAAYSRADHSHGTPTLPPLGGDLSGELGGIDSTLPRISRLQNHLLDASEPADGDMLVYQRRRPDSVEGAWTTRRPTLSVPPFGGDLTGTIGTEQIKSLQTKPLNAPNPGPNQVLTFNGSEWVAASVATQGGVFVGRGPEPFEIVAAGEIGVVASVSDARARVESSYGSLAVTATTHEPRTERIVIGLRGTVAESRSLVRYIVKLTPVLSRELSMPFRLFLLGAVTMNGSDLTFGVLLIADESIADEGYAFHVEVSRFGGR
jgi:hypothetical protein